MILVIYIYIEMNSIRLLKSCLRSPKIGIFRNRSSKPALTLRTTYILREHVFHSIK